MLVSKGLRFILFVLGWISIVFAIIGAVLPVMPTVPFLILAAFLFSKSSPRFHKWLLELPQFGPVLVEWEKNKTIRKEVKISAIAGLNISILLTIIFVPVSVWVKVLLGAIALCVSLYIATRKTPDNL